MWSTHDDRRRTSRDMPPRSSARYYDTLYAQPSTSRAAPRYAGGLDPADPVPSSSPRDHHHRRRMSVDEPPSHSAAAAKAPPRRSKSINKPTVVASDDGWGTYGGVPAPRPDRVSRHDVEAKTGDGHRKFREKRSGYEEDEAQKLRRAKSHSPRRAAKEAADEPRRTSPQAPAKSNWPGDEYASAAGSGAGLHRSATHGKTPRAPQYYEDDPRGGRARTRDRGYDYATPAPGGGRTTAGEYPPYKSSPLSAPEEKVEKARGKHHAARSREREVPYHAGGLSIPEEKIRGRHHDAPPREREAPYHAGGSAGGSRYSPHEPSSDPPRRGRHGRAAAEDKTGPPDVDSYAAPPRTRHRPSPPSAYEDPYESTSRARQRQSMPPPQARSRYAPDDHEEPAAPPRRRATSMSQGQGRPGYDPRDARDPRVARQQDHYDERPGRSSSGSGESPGRASGGSGGGGGGQPTSAYRKEKGKKIGKQAGKLFMTHAFPVIKQEAVPFLTKAAQAYFEQKR